MLQSSKAVLTATLLLAFAGCSGSAGGGGTDDGHQPTSSTWTIFVYGHADHNLSQSLVRDIVEMSLATVGSNLNVIVAADWSAGRLGPTGDPFPSGTEWYRIVGSGQAPVLIGTQPEQNFDDPATLRSAIEAVFDAYPADRYGVVLWDHGGSWQLGFGSDEHDTPANPADDTYGMTAAQAAGAIRVGLASSGLTGTRSLDFVAFDTCLMAGNEVAYEFRDLASVYLAAAEIDFGDGWDYQATLSYLSASASATARSFAQNEVSHWNAHHLDAGIDDLQLRSHVAIDLAAFDAYADEWASLSAAMADSTGLDWDEVARAQYFAQPGYGMTFANPVAFPALRDAGQLLDTLATIASDSAVAAQAAATRQALASAVIASAQGSLRSANHQVGVHAEVSLPADWAERRAGYSGLAWNAATGWSSAMDRFANAADAIAPVIATALQNGTSPTTQSPPTLTLSSTDEDAVEGRVYLAETIAGDVLYYGLIGMGAMEGSTLYQFTWNGRMVAMSDGVSLSEVTVIPWISGASPVFVIPGLLSHPEGDYQALAIADIESEDISSMFVVLDDRLAAFETRHLRGATFTPLVLNATKGSLVPAQPLLIPDVGDATLRVSLEQVAPGAYHLITNVIDVWGNAGTKIDNVTVTAPF